MYFYMNIVQNIYYIISNTNEMQQYFSKVRFDFLKIYPYFNLDFTFGWVQYVER